MMDTNTKVSDYYSFVLMMLQNKTVKTSKSILPSFFFK